MVTTPVNLTDEELEALRDLAEREGVPVDQVIRRGINAVLGAEAEAEADTRQRRAVAAIGAFHSGRHDVSRRHDEYLADALDECASS